MFTALPLIETSTPAQRLQALKDARELLTTTPGETKPLVFGGGSVETVYAPDTAEMIRIAEYITTGHDYKDTHPAGKRRPITRHTTHVTVMAPPGVPEEDIEHFLHHVENGDFADFVKDMVREQETVGDEEAHGDADPDGGSK